MGRRLVKLSAGTDANRLVEGEQEFVYLPTATKIKPYAFIAFDEQSVPLKFIVMPNVTIIDYFAFYLCKSLALTELPSGLTRIAGNAFSDCVNLALTKLPRGLKIIGEAAFSNCTSLALTELPSGITRIGGYAFNECNSLTTITFKGTPTTIDKQAFSNCTNLTTINVPWAEGTFPEAEAAKFGAESATINFNYTEE